jgi:hypothetical protein
MAFYRKTTPSSYPNTPASNFTDSSKNWRKHANMYRKTSGNETASLTAVPGRYTDDTRTWRRIKAMYRRTSSGTWQKIFSKFAGQPYPEVSAKIRYNSYTGTDVIDFAMMGPGANGIAQGAAGITYLWGRDGADWQNIENLTSRSRTFVFGSRPIRENAGQVLNDEGNYEGDKLRNTEAVILQYDGQYIWYRDRISVSSTSGSSTGTSYSQTVRVIKQQPVINSIAFKTDNNVSAGERKDVSFSIANEWYRSIDKTNSMFRWYILDSQYETPTAAKLWNSTSVSSVILTENTTVITGEDFFTIPTTFNGVSTTGKWLHVQLACKNTSSDNDLDYSLAPYNDVTDQVIAQIGTSMPSFTYSLTNISSVTTPSAPVQQRVSTTSNTVLVEMGSSFPSNTESYELRTYGTGSSAGGTLANPSVQYVTTLNQYFSNGDISYNGTFDAITNISSSASNSPISTFTRAVGPSRSLQFNVSSTTGAQSWRINYTISGSSSSNGTFVLNTNSMPATITPIFGVANPTVTITGVTAYSGLNQTGSTKAGTAGSTTSLSSIAKPTADSSTSTSNYTYYSNLQFTGSKRRVTLPSVFNSGTTIYVSTNGYINWGGSSLPEVDRGTSISIPALDNSGITIAPLNGDLRQGAVSATSNTSTGGLWYFADASNFWVTWWGNYYQDAAQVARYQVKFYWGSNVADIYIVNNSLTTLTPSTTAVQNNQNQFQNWSTTTVQDSVLLSTATMNRVSTQDGVDDGRTVIVASPPVLTWTVTWDAAGGEGGTQLTTQNRGLSHTAPSPGARDGFDFVNYRYPASGGTDPVLVGSGGSYTPTSSVTFGAIWTTKTYSVSYNANLGTGAPSPQTKTHGVALTLSSTAPTRATVGSTSYAFNGWNTASDGTGTNYSAGGSYTANSPVTLYAKWTATTVVSKLGTPTGQSATTTRTDGVNITWTAVTGASYYGVWYGGAPGYDYLADFGGNRNISLIPQSANPSYLDTGISAGSTRDYYIQAYKSGDPAGTKSDWSAAAYGTRATAPATPATAPGTPGTPTNGWTGGVVYPFSWTAPSSSGTVSGGGTATISSYQIKIYRASDSAGTGSTLYNTYTSTGSGLTYTFNAPDGLYYAASVSATNSAGLSSLFYSGISLYK